MTGWRRATLTDDLFDLSAYCFERNVERLESFGCDAFAFMNESEQNVLGADVRMIEQAGFFLSQHYDPAGPVGKAFEH